MTFYDFVFGYHRHRSLGGIAANCFLSNLLVLITGQGWNLLAIRTRSRFISSAIEKIKTLLYEKKYSISGAKGQLVKERKQGFSDQLEMNLSMSSNAVKILKKAKEDLLNLKEMLSKDI